MKSAPSALARAMKFTASATFFSSSPIGLAIGCTTAMRKLMGELLDATAATLVARGSDLKRAPQVGDQRLAHSLVISLRRPCAPDRLRPRGVTPAACNHVHVQLRDHVAECGDVELVAGGEVFQRVGCGGDLVEELDLRVLPQVDDFG